MMARNEVIANARHIAYRRVRREHRRRTLLFGMAVLIIIGVAGTLGMVGCEEDNANGAHTCTNGTPVPGTPSEGNTESCASCDDGYLLSAEKTCAPRKCTNGTPAPASADGIETCVSCNSGYLLSVDKFCQPIPDYVDFLLHNNIHKVSEFTANQFSIIVEYAKTDDACPADVMCNGAALESSCRCDVSSALTFSLAPRADGGDPDPQVLRARYGDHLTAERSLPSKAIVEYRATRNLTAADSPARALQIVDLPGFGTASAKETILADFDTTIDLARPLTDIDRTSRVTHIIPWGDGADNYSPLSVKLGDKVDLACQEDTFGSTILVQPAIYNSATCSADLGDDDTIGEGEEQERYLFLPGAVGYAFFGSSCGTPNSYEITRSSTSLNNALSFTSGQIVQVANLFYYPADAADEDTRPTTGFTALIRPNDHPYSGAELKRSFCARFGVKIQIQVR